MNSLEVANTIKSQLTYGGMNKIRVMSWGANKFQYGIDEGENFGFLIFKVQGFKFKGEVKISLSYNDTYKVEFIKIKRKKDIELREIMEQPNSKQQKRLRRFLKRFILMS